jgi:hypothetical protein
LRTDIALTRLLGRTSTAAGGGNAVCAEAGHADAACAGQLSRAATATGRGVGVGVVDDAHVRAGAAAEVVIHATAAEIAAILDREPGTGGDVDGHGPLPQAALVDILIRASGPARGHARPTTVRWHRTDDPPASPPDQYAPSRRLDRWVRERDRRCRFPGCGHPARYCDLDHVDPFDPGNPHGARTTAGNLHALCRHHHRLKHRGGWKLRRAPDGSTTWTSPTGRDYRIDPDDG